MHPREISPVVIGRNTTKTARFDMLESGGDRRVRLAAMRHLGCWKYFAEVGEAVTDWDDAQHILEAVSYNICDAVSSVQEESVRQSGEMHNALAEFARSLGLDLWFQADVPYYVPEERVVKNDLTALEYATLSGFLDRDPSGQLCEHNTAVHSVVSRLRQLTESTLSEEEILSWREVIAEQMLSQIPKKRSNLLSNKILCAEREYLWLKTILSIQGASVATLGASHIIPVASMLHDTYDWQVDMSSIHYHTTFEWYPPEVG